MESKHVTTELKPDVTEDRALLRLLRRCARAVLALALVTSLTAAALLAVSLPRTAELPSVLISHSEGFSFYVSGNSMRDLLVPSVLSDLYERFSDGMAEGDKSELVITEDGRKLGPAHQQHAKIRSDGGGAYSNWEGALYMSTSDNSDARTNGRRYEVATYLHVTPWLETNLWITIKSTLAIALCAALSLIFLCPWSRWAAVLKPALENSLLLAIMPLKPGAVANRSLLLLLLLGVGAKAVLALALVTSLLATGLLAVRLPRTAKLPPALISPSEGFSFYVSGNSMRDLLVPSILSDLYEPYSDGMAESTKSELVIREDGRNLKPAHQPHVKIRSDGGGAYSNWGGALYMSTSDNSDVCTNGRSYEVETYLHVTPWLESALWISIKSALIVALCAALSIIFLYPQSRWAAVLFLKSTLENSLLVAGSIALLFGCLEGFLWAWSNNNVVQPLNISVPLPGNDLDAVPPDVVATANGRLQILTMPDSWKRTPTEIAGAAHADYWHGALEVYNSDGLRWTTPFPEKQDDTYRVMVVGDSLTYGDGLRERWRFSNLLGEWMGQRFRIEFINLGHDGYQSEDILNLIGKDLPLLRPNLVLYAVCLNDFFPSGRGQYDTHSAYPFPLPESVKSYLIRNTRAGAYLSEIYDRALRRLHLRGDFYDNLLADIDEYKARFAHDVAQMNESVRSAGLPPLVGMVVDQIPVYGGRGYRLAMIAETALAQAGAIVIPTEDYYRRYSGQALYISRWEGHPNEVANWIWASMIARALRERRDLQAFRK